MKNEEIPARWVLKADKLTNFDTMSVPRFSTHIVYHIPTLSMLSTTLMDLPDRASILTVRLPRLRPPRHLHMQLLQHRLSAVPFNMGQPPPHCRVPTGSVARR